MTTVKKKTVEVDEKNDIVLVQLDRLREVRFGHKALKKLAAMLNKNISNIDESDFDLGEIEKVMFCGLEKDAKAHGENLELADMEDLLDLAPSYGDIIKAMNTALNISFQETEKQKN